MGTGFHFFFLLKCVVVHRMEDSDREHVDCCVQMSVQYTSDGVCGGGLREMVALCKDHGELHKQESV